MESTSGFYSSNSANFTEGASSDNMGQVNISIKWLGSLLPNFSGHWQFNISTDDDCSRLLTGTNAFRDFSAGHNNLYSENLTNSVTFTISLTAGILSKFLLQYDHDGCGFAIYITFLSPPGIVRKSGEGFVFYNASKPTNLPTYSPTKHHVYIRVGIESLSVLPMIPPFTTLSADGIQTGNKDALSSEISSSSGIHMLTDDSSNSLVILSSTYQPSPSPTIPPTCSSTYRPSSPPKTLPTCSPTYRPSSILPTYSSTYQPSLLPT
mmetsp:Transcript_29601/g.40667  ORF Transcript_29601/g.40667 Transcript_29601/m.40667 type:complete len:265 (-) Transcript_29601:25-819(-)